MGRTNFLVSFLSLIATILIFGTASCALHSTRLLSPAEHTPTAKPDLPCGSISGLFRDSATSEAVSGVQISEYCWLARAGGQDEIKNLKQAAQARSTSDGRFVMANLPPGPYLLARGDGSAFGLEDPHERILVEVHPGEQLDGLVFNLQPGIQVEGRVVSEKGQPIERAEVQAFQQEGEPCITSSDAEGKFLFRGMKINDMLILRAAAPGFASVESAKDVDNRLRIVGSSDVSGLELVLPPGRCLDGKLVDKAGRPMPGANLSVGMGFEAQSRNDGSFVFMGIPQKAPDKATLRGYVGGSDLKFLRGTENVRLGTTVRAVACVEPYYPSMRKMRRDNLHPRHGMTTGHVVDSEGNPLDGIEIDVGEPGVVTSKCTISGPNGRFALDLSDSGNVSLTVDSAGFVFDTFRDILCGSKGNVLKVRRSIGINIAVRDGRTDEPIKWLRVATLWPGQEWTPGPKIGKDPHSSSIYTPDGRFTIRTQIPNQTQVSVTAPGYGTSNQLVNLDSLGRETVEFRLLPERTIAGTTVTADGAPMPHAFVAAMTDTGQDGGGLATRAIVEDDGGFVLRGLDPRAYRVRASQKGFDSAGTSVDLTQQPTANVKLVLEKTRAK